MNKGCAGCRYNRSCWCLYTLNPRMFECKKAEMLEKDLIEEALDKIEKFVKKVKK